MKRPALACAVLLSLGTVGAAQEPLPRRESNYSLRNEVVVSIDKGLAWLKKMQNADGSWTGAGSPALTALPLLAFLRKPSEWHRASPRADFLERGFVFLRSKAKPDGAIGGPEFRVSNTSLCTMAFIANADRQDGALLAKARKFLIGVQVPAKSGVGGGGIGESSLADASKDAPSLDRTFSAIEALAALRTAIPDSNVPPEKPFDWNAAVAFVARCQIPQPLPAAPENGDDDRGGFVSAPSFSESAPADGSDPRRPYGSASCAGLLAYLYAGTRVEDPRVRSVLGWLERHYTVDRNPGLEAAGRYRYLYLISEGFAAAGIEDLQTIDGAKVDWARETALKLVEIQETNGSWVNGDSARWWENEPVLTTSYSLLALEILYQRL